MTTRAMVDPELLQALETFQSETPTTDNLARLRRERDRLPETNQPADPSLATLSLFLAGDVPVRVFTPIGGDEAATYPALLHLHGGGFVFGRAQQSDAANAALAAELACVIVSVDYRLAPETPHPGPVEDAYTALKWLHAEADALRVDRSRLAVGGESAGGGMAASLALLTRDRGEVSLIFQLLIYPMLDDRTGSLARAQPVGGEFVWTPAHNRFAWAALLGHEPDDTTPAYAAAARADDLHGLPPAFLSIGALDLFIDENLEYARRLIAAGVPTEMHVFPGAYHVFDKVLTARNALVARNRVRAALRRAFNRDGR